MNVHVSGMMQESRMKEHLHSSHFYKFLLFLFNFIAKNHALDIKP